MGALRVCTRILAKNIYVYISKPEQRHDEQVLAPPWTPHMSRAWHGREEEVHQFEEGEAAVLWAAGIVQEGLSPQEIMVMNALES
jgi:hypothetical protein